MKKNLTGEAKKMFDATGNVGYNDQLTSFLYELMRDHLPAGTVARIVMNCPCYTPTHFCNGHLAKFAHYLANELTEKLPDGGVRKKLPPAKKKA